MIFYDILDNLSSTQSISALRLSSPVPQTPSDAMRATLGLLACLTPKMIEKKMIVMARMLFKLPHYRHCSVSACGLNPPELDCPQLFRHASFLRRQVSHEA